MPRTLLLMRHAKSGCKQSDLPDHDRPLKRKGKRDARAMARALRRLKIVPDVIVTSIARRARSTARRVADVFDEELPILEERRLYGGTPKDYLRIMADLPAKAHTVLLIGHNPAISEFCGLIADQQVLLSTADIVQIDLPIANWGDYRVKRNEGHVVRVLSRHEKAKTGKA